MEGSLWTLGLHKNLQYLLMCFSDQVQIWKATCLEHPESLNTYPTKPCVTLSAHSSVLCVSKVWRRNLHISKFCSESAKPRRAQDGYLATHHIPIKHMTKVLCWPFLDHLQSQAPKNLVLGWANDISIARTCQTVMAVEERLMGPKEDFGSLFIA